MHKLQSNFRMTLLDLVPMMETDDMRKTVDFYTGVLGFTLKRTFGSQGEITWITLEMGKAGLMFSTRFEATRDHPCVMTGSLYFYPDDVKALWEEIGNKAKIDWPLQAFGYGMTEFAIFDNNGYRLIFGQ